MNTNHILSAFDRDLEGVQAKVMRMGGLVEQALRDSITALLGHDIELASRVRKDDRAIDELDETVKSDCARILALRSPTAVDLRVVLSVIEISSNLERCGDYAKNIAKRTPSIGVQHDIMETGTALRRMAEFVQAMLSDALDSYIHQDEDKALDVIQRDVEADQMYNTLFRSLLTHMMEDPRSIATAMHLHFIAKNIERVGDHATGICEQAIYVLTGEMPQEPRPKQDSTTRM